MNSSLLPIVLSLAHGMGAMTFLLWIHSEVERHIRTSTVTRELCLGLLFGAASIFALIDPIVLQPGLIVDVRNVFIGLAGPYGGPLALIVATALAGASRMSLGGVGALPSLLGFGAVGIATLLFMAKYRVSPSAISSRHLVVLGAISCSWAAGLLVLPSEMALLFAREALLPTLALTVGGVLLLGTLLSREARRVEAEAALRRSALTDALTGLPNRRAFDSELERRLSQARRANSVVAVMMLDVDFFKRVNDVLGHAAGDEAIAAVGRIIQSTVRKEDLAARVGGEEFALIVSLAHSTDAGELAERIRSTIAENPIRISGETVPLTASIGVAVNTGHEPGVELVKQADKALYRAKDLGRNRVCFQSAPTLPQ